MANVKSVPNFVVLKHPVTKNLIVYPGGHDQQDLDSAASYKAASNDIFVCAYPKCGTTWLQNIVWLIVHHGETVSKSLRKCIPMLEFDGCNAVEAIDNSKYPRIIKTHFPYEETPQNKDAKYVYITRNPKDALVSYYYHVKGFPQYYDCPDVTLEEVYKLFVQGKVEFNGFFENVGSWYEQRHQPNVLFLLYEDLKRDLRGNILKIARFLGENYLEEMKVNSEKLLNLVVEESSFKSMKGKTTQWTNAERPKNIPFIRKGEVGDWKHHLTKEQSEEIDRLLKEKGRANKLDVLWNDFPEVRDNDSATVS